MTADRVPLTALVAWAWIAHTIEVDNQFEVRSAERVGHRFRISLPLWTNALRFIDEDGVTIGVLHRRAKAACNIGGLERWGWISVGDGGDTRRSGFGTHKGVKVDTIVRPTRAGMYARRLWPQVVSGVEEQWRVRFGGDVIDRLHDALIGFAPAMPWSPPEVHPSDGFFTHVIDGEPLDAPVPLVGLLGQTLTALTVDHERDAEVSLPLGADVLRVIDSGEIPIRDLPERSGLSKEGTAMAAGFLQRRDLAVMGPQRAIRLTDTGRHALEDYWRRAEHPGRGELRSALEAVLARRDAVAEGLVPPEGCWRNERPYLAQTRRRLADPIGALPWQPMVLHRGSWPDGS